MRARAAHFLLLSPPWRRLRRLASQRSRLGRPDLHLENPGGARGALGRDRDAAGRQLLPPGRLRHLRPRSASRPGRTRALPRHQSRAARARRDSALLPRPPRSVRARARRSRGRCSSPSTRCSRRPCSTSRAAPTCWAPSSRSRRSGFTCGARAGATRPRSAARALGGGALLRACRSGARSRRRPCPSRSRPGIGSFASEPARLARSGCFGCGLTRSCSSRMPGGARACRARASRSPGRATRRRASRPRSLPCADYARLLVLPVGLHLERFTSSDPPWRPLAGSLLLGLALAGAWRARPEIRFWLAWAAFAYLPTSNLVPVYPGLPVRGRLRTRALPLPAVDGPRDGARAGGGSTPRAAEPSRRV